MGSRAATSEDVEPLCGGLQLQIDKMKEHTHTHTIVVVLSHTHTRTHKIAGWCCEADVCVHLCVSRVRGGCDLVGGGGWGGVWSHHAGWLAGWQAGGVSGGRLHGGGRGCVLVWH